MTETSNNSSILGIEGLPQFFLVLDEDSDREVLEKCEKLILDHWGSKTKLKWLTTQECLDLDTDTFAKTDVFVFPEFKGPAFENLRIGKRALLLGPPVLIKCLEENEIIPTAPPPWIFNSAMNGLVITMSGMKESEKAKYADLIAFMGGLCMSVLPDAGTHLISNTVFSAKYEAAVHLKIPVMRFEWIDEVWKRNANGFVAATDPQFDDFKLPVFYNLNVTCTLLTNEEKQMVEKLVTGNGGIFHRTFKPQVVNILVVNEKGKNSDKFKAACKHKKICVLPQWIQDSVTEGFALPFTGYQVEGEVRVSTPNKGAVQNPEFSVSHIQGSGNTTVNDSLISVRSMLQDYPSQVPQPAPGEAAGAIVANDYYKDCIKNLNLTKAKKAGCFLDGCNIYFSGFTTDEMNKLNKVISLSGATRFDELNEDVTHVIVGKRDDKELKAFHDMNKGIHFVKFDWLKDSMEAKHAANEDDYCYELAAATNKTVLLEQPSPASKRNIAAMNSSFKKPFPKNNQMSELSKKPTPNQEDEDDFVIPRSNLMNRYLQSTAENMDIIERTAPQKENTTKAPKPNRSARSTMGRRDNSLLHTTFDSDLETGDYENLTFFNGLSFAVQDVENINECAQMLTDIRSFGGTIIERTDQEVDYLVTAALPMRNYKPRFKAKFEVNNWWIEDVIAGRAEVPVEYYHQVIAVTDETVLRGTTVTISTFTGVERMFMTIVAESLGATVEEKYEKKKFPILICPVAEGGKYKGALAWGYPVVSKEWLLDAFHKSCLPKLEDYLVGTSTVAERHQHYCELNARGIRKGEDPPTHNDSSIIQIRSESPLLSQVPASPMVSKSISKSVKRKSDDEDTFVRNMEKKMKTHDNLVLLPNCSPSVNNRVKALRSESKSSSSPTTPISQHIREMGQEFGYDTPRRKQLYDVLKETNNLTPATPHTPEIMKMPKTQLHPDPEATPGRQWDVLHKFSGFLSNDERGASGSSAAAEASRKKKAPVTPLSEIKRRFWQQTLGEDYVYNNNSTMMNINSQQLPVNIPRDSLHNDTTVGPDGLDTSVASTSKAPESADLTVPEEASTVLQGLTDFISKRKSEPKRPIENLETCPVLCADSEAKDPEIMVGWAEPNEVVPFNTPPPARPRRETTNPRKTPFFIQSGLDTNAEHVTMIQEMNGEIQKKKNTEYDPKCTHLICHKLGRVEKALCAIAAGKWIVPLRYIQESCEAKEFLDEELFEFANPKSKTDMTAWTTLEKDLAQAAYEWRLRIQDKKSDKYRTGAFHGFKVLLWSKVVSFKRIIEAGGGICLDVGLTSYASSAELAKTATHCIVEKKAGFPAGNLKFCQEHGIKVYDNQYLNEYLVNVNSPMLKKFEYHGRTSTAARAE